MSGGAAMSDILGQGGGDREPRSWPRRLAAIAAVVVLAVLAAVYLPGHLHGPARSPHGSATAAPPEGGPDYAIAVPSVGGEPAGIPGPTLPWGKVTLPVTGDRPAWLSPATGRTTRISGLPPSGTGYQFTLVGGGWAVQSALAGSTVCSYCNTTPLPVYFLGDQARSATEIGMANLVAPGAATGELWLTSYRTGAEIPEGPAMAQEFSATGAPLGPQLTLPAGEVIVQATDRGLLLGPATPGTGTAADTLWDPARPHASRTFSGVLAASAAEIAWAPQCAQGSTPACRVQVLDLVTGSVTTVALPGDSSAASGAFSPDGQFLAIEASFSDGGSLAAQLYVATVATGHLTAVPRSFVSSDALVGFGWPTGGDSLVAELNFMTTVQVASWRPGAPDLAVAAIRPGTDSTSLVIG
jgi:hypothetical protein